MALPRAPRKNAEADVSRCKHKQEPETLPGAPRFPNYLRFCTSYIKHLAGSVSRRRRFSELGPNETLLLKESRGPIPSEE